MLSIARRMTKVAGVIFFVVSLIHISFGAACQARLPPSLGGEGKRKNLARISDTIWQIPWSHFLQKHQNPELYLEGLGVAFRGARLAFALQNNSPPLPSPVRSSHVLCT